MTTYIAKFSLVNGKTTIHAVGCRAAVKRNGFTFTEVEAVNAGMAAAKFDAQEDGLVSRGFPFPKVCACAKPAKKVAT